MYFLDKKNKAGEPLEADTIKLADKLVSYCFNETKKSKIYQELKKNFQNKYLEIFFKSFYYHQAIPLCCKIVLNTCDKNNKDEKLNIRSFTAKKYLKNFLNENNINYKDTFDKNVLEKKIKNFIINIKNVIKKLITFFIKKKIRFDPSEKIAIAYNDGVDTDKKSDLFWIKNSGVNPKDIFLYFEYRGQLKRHGTKKKLLGEINKIGIKYINLWEYEILDEEVDFLNKLEKKIFNLIDNRDEKFLLKISNELIHKFKYWYLFFKKFHIKIHQDTKEFGQDAIIKYLALNKLKGCTIGRLKSFIEQKRASGPPPINPADIFFVPNKNSANRSKKFTLNKYHNIIINGNSYNPSTSKNLKELEDIKKFFQKNKKRFIILFLDSGHSSNKNNYFQQTLTKDLYNFYDFFLNELFKIDEVGVIIKPKKLSDIVSLDDIYLKILEFQKKGFCYFVNDPFSKMPASYASISDLTISTCHCFPSSLMECVLKNNKGLFFDLVNIKSLEEDWFSWGEGKVIFNDKNDLINKIKKMHKEKLIDKEFANWTNYKDYLDPYNDDKGSERVGNYINTLMKSFKKHVGFPATLEKANKEFKKIWGEDKIVY